MSRQLHGERPESIYNPRSKMNSLLILLLSILSSIPVLGMIFQTVDTLMKFEVGHYEKKVDFLKDLIPGYPLIKKFNKLK